MPFPDVKRIIYKKNPLQQVICQLRFPPILKIDSEIPSQFQEFIRADFPNFKENIEPMGKPIPEEIMNFAPHMFSSILKTNKNYEFSSKNHEWQVNLTRVFVALTTTKYERWEIFRKKLELVVDSIQEIYSPSFFTRIGLRYIDVIERSQLGLKNERWDDLINPLLLGGLNSEDIKNDIINYESKYNIRLSDNESNVTIQIRVLENPTEEQSFVIDSDFCISKEIDSKREILFDKLDYFHKQASYLIQWCIKEKLHKAMEPLEL